MSKILVVDDIKDNITLLSFDLEDDGHEIITAHNGEECLAMACKERPDLILLDIMMPVMGGKEALTHLKADEDLKDIPVIMVSANDGDEEIISALDIGAHDYVAKPFVYPILAARIRSALRLKRSQEDLQEANEALEKLASYDSLTNAYNRRQFFNLAEAEFSKSKRSQQPLSLIMLDVDKFKAVNDNYGHSGGDQALIDLTNLCKDICRSSDIFSRFGGEEFVICCPNSDIQGAHGLAERLRVATEQNITLADGNEIKFTISLGVTCVQAEDESLELALNRADLLLYEAKNSGRNQVVIDH
jgi:diguanylate cyclase (GGDEF)-like protein